jgi:hypothetical protein
MKKTLRVPNELYPNAVLLGIAAQLPDYRLVHFLNKHPDVDLVKKPDLVVQAKTKGLTGHYPFFTAYNEAFEFQVCLVGNQQPESPPLIKDLKNLDYMMILLDLTQQYDLTALIKGIRDIPGVLIVQSVDTGRITNISHIFSAIELHLLDIRNPS